VGRLTITYGCVAVPEDSIIGSTMRQFRVNCEHNWQKRVLARLVIRMGGKLPAVEQVWTETKLPYPNDAEKPPYSQVIIVLGDAYGVHMIGYREVSGSNEKIMPVTLLYALTILWQYGLVTGKLHVNR
jgi:hypothetical protein